MWLDIYQAETLQSLDAQRAILQSARDIMRSGRPLTLIEEAGMLHALQISIENAIGKGKHWLKAKGLPVPVSAYDVFVALANAELLPRAELSDWNAIIGLRNRIVHDYMNLDIEFIEALILENKEAFVLDFLARDFPDTQARP